MHEIDTAELKANAPLIPYITTHYQDKIHIESRSKNAVFAKCLWHDENTASLAFFANGTYKCFGGCGAHGDIITLVQSLENVSFEEACKIIGDNVGYEVVLEPPNIHHENYKNKLDDHTRRYWSLLQKNAEALNYLMNERGISSEMIDRFRLGFTGQEEYKYRSDIGNISSKIVFPILEHKRKNPKCVGMAYRGLTNDKPKYINDANQDGRDGQDPNLAGVFIKGNMLYGLHQAYEGIKKTGYVTVVEGYFDVISLHQSGITNAVCTMGTSLTESQIATLSKVTNNVLLLYDGDPAGTSGMMHAIQNLFTAGINVAVCTLDRGYDPADLCKARRFDYHKVNNEIRDHTMPAIEFVIDKVAKPYESIAMKERMKAMQAATPILNAVKDDGMKQMYTARLFKRLDIN